MSEKEMQPQDAPPIESEPLDLAEESKWPQVIGIFSIIYALLGITCQGFGVLSLLLAPLWQAMSGIEIAAPPILQILTYVSFAIYLSLGIFLFIGGMRLLRRRSRGLANLKAWAVIRLAMVMVSFVAGYLTLPANVEMQRSINESVNEILAKNNQPEQPFDENAIYSRTVIFTSIAATVTSIYPLFLGFYLSRKKISDEVNTWESRMFD